MSDVLALLAARRSPVARHAYVCKTQLSVEDINRMLASVSHDFIEVHDEVVLDAARRLTASELLYSGVSLRSAEEVWTCGDGRRIRIGDMEHKHLVHALALVMRKLREESGFWALNRHGALRHYQPLPRFEERGL